MDPTEQAEVPQGRGSQAGEPVSRASALAWRAGQHGLTAPGAATAVAAVSRVIALRAWPAHLAELATTVRVPQPQPDALANALATGELVRSYSLRGGSYLATPEHARLTLAVRRTSRVWETRRYQQQGGFEIDDWRPLREAVRDALVSGALTRPEIGARLAHIPALAHLADAAATGAGADSLLKPLHWWGEVSFGPERDGQTTFQLLPDRSDGPGTVEPEDAGLPALRAYLHAYAPATRANLGYWFTEGLSVPKRTLERWLAALGDELGVVSTDRGPAYALAADLAALRSATPLAEVWLLPGGDPWILGPGTADSWLVRSDRRGLASRGSNLVARAGVIVGTWRTQAEVLSVTWFTEAGPVRVAELRQAVDRLADRQDREYRLVTELD